MYGCSVSVSALLVYAIGLPLCGRAAPRPVSGELGLGVVVAEDRCSGHKLLDFSKCVPLLLCPIEFGVLSTDVSAPCVLLVWAGT